MFLSKIYSVKVLKVTIIKFLCEHIMTKLNFSEHSRKSTIAESIMLSNQQKLQKKTRVSQPAIQTPTRQQVGSQKKRRKLERFQVLHLFEK